MEKNLFRQTYAPELVSDQLILKLNGIDFPDSFIGILRSTEQSAFAFKRLYKEEHLEEIQLLKFIQVVLRNTSKQLGICPDVIKYSFDDIWLQKNKAILLAILVEGLLAEISKDYIFAQEPRIEIQCRFLFGKLEFGYLTDSVISPEEKILSSRSQRLIETVVKMLPAKINYRSSNEFGFDLTFKS
ncbi:hypothetical protein L0657_27245 [Dyadobacter sp. CY345]|uniref:hypothetical protein n=1 Tax=Dyadobacter sp. CY345 TaxID=2909335 RepID=UPI001F28DD20|nr:hypothetical protein [Dyadobacter sp. CY345]MCF2447681.1 hypothetical protein [Dyadobacter sp. CY345]